MQDKSEIKAEVKKKLRHTIRARKQMRSVLVVLVSGLLLVVAAATSSTDGCHVDKDFNWLKPNLVLPFKHGELTDRLGFPNRYTINCVGGQCQNLDRSRLIRCSNTGTDADDAPVWTCYQDGKGVDLISAAIQCQTADRFRPKYCKRLNSCSLDVVVGDLLTTSTTTTTRTTTPLAAAELITSAAGFSFLLTFFSLLAMTCFFIGSYRFVRWFWTEPPPPQTRNDDAGAIPCHRCGYLGHEAISCPLTIPTPAATTPSYSHQTPPPTAPPYYPELVETVRRRSTSIAAPSKRIPDAISRRAMEKAKEKEREKEREQEREKEKEKQKAKEKEKEKEKMPRPSAPPPLPPPKQQEVKKAGDGSVTATSESLLPPPLPAASLADTKKKQKEKVKKKIATGEVTATSRSLSPPPPSSPSSPPSPGSSYVTY